LFIGLKQKGWEIHILTIPKSPLKPVFESIGIRVFENHPTSKFDKQAILFLKRLMLTESYDIVHTFNSKATAMVNRINRKSCSPFIHIGYRGSEGPFWYEIIDYWALYHPHVDAIMCSSHFVMKSISKNNLLWKKDLFLVYKGVDIEPYDQVQPISREEIGVSTNDFLVIAIANIRPVKGIQYLIEAFHQIPNHLPLKLLLVGKDTDSPSMVRQVNNGCNASKIISWGYQNNILPLLKAADLYIQPSLSEGLSKSVIEAMALGIPVVSTRCGGPEELIEHDKNGLLIDKKSTSQITAAMLTMEANPEKRKSYSAAATTFIKEHLNSQKALHQLETAYLKLLQQKLSS